MIYSLNGFLIYSDVTNNSAVIECGGVGYSVNLTAPSFSKLPLPNENGGVAVKIFTYMCVRDDGIELFGFADKSELDAFRLLITVSGVGPKAALSVLSVLTPNELAAAISSDDSKAISRAQNVGSKTAARIILELKDKYANVFASGQADVATSSTRTSSRGFSDAADALLALGYSTHEINSALSKLSGVEGTENIIRSALIMLSK